MTFRDSRAASSCRRHQAAVKTSHLSFKGCTRRDNPLSFHFADFPIFSVDACEAIQSGVARPFIRRRSDVTRRLRLISWLRDSFSREEVAQSFRFDAFICVTSADAHTQDALAFSTSLLSQRVIFSQESDGKFYTFQFTSIFLKTAKKWKNTEKNFLKIWWPSLSKLYTVKIGHEILFYTRLSIGGVDLNKNTPQFLLISSF